MRVLIKVRDDEDDDGLGPLLERDVSHRTNDWSGKNYNGKDSPPPTQTRNTLCFGNTKCLNPHECHVGDPKRKGSLTNIPSNAPATEVAELSKAIK